MWQNIIRNLSESCIGVLTWFMQLFCSLKISQIKKLPKKVPSVLLSWQRTLTSSIAASCNRERMSRRIIWRGAVSQWSAIYWKIQEVKSSRETTQRKTNCAFKTNLTNTVRSNRPVPGRTPHLFHLDTKDKNHLLKKVEKIFWK